jgi:hypothetical protein
MLRAVLALALCAACVVDPAVDDSVVREGSTPLMSGTYVHDGDCQGQPEDSCRSVLRLDPDGRGELLGDGVAQRITWTSDNGWALADLPWGATRFEAVDDGWILIDDRYGFEWYRLEE